MSKPPKKKWGMDGWRVAGLILAALIVYWLVASR
jgi:hypothetical protein